MSREPEQPEQPEQPEPAGPRDDPTGLEELLAPVLDLPCPEQDEALAAVCRAHPHRAAAVLRRYGILCRFGLVAEDGGQSARRLPAAAPCERFGPFRLLHELGRGGMGVVYLAEDPGLGRQIALKLIRPEYLDSERARERFRREVGLAARLEHRGICTVYGAGEIEGQPYLALQHVRGATLEKLLRDARAAGRSAWSGGSSSQAGSSGTERLRPVALRPALELVEALARAVHCAHEAGLVHRDLKPGNVMVTPEGDPVLMDFGLARDESTAAAGLTGSGELVGTPVYMAPEQVAPKGRRVDRRTDVHALGTVLYECLTLRPPHPGANREELYHRILVEEPVELRRLQPAASRDLSTVVHRALEKDPARRYPTALAFAEDLRRVLEGHPTVARPPGPVRRAWVGLLRHRTLTAAGAALLLGLGGSLWFLWHSVLAERRFEALALVARAKEVQPEDPELAFAAMRAALDIAEEPEVIAAIHGVLAELKSWSPVRRIDARMQSLTPSPARRWLVANCAGGPAALHDAEGAFVGEFALDVGEGVQGVSLFPQNPAVAFAPDEGALWATVDSTGHDKRPGLCRFELGAPGPHVLGRRPPGRRVLGVTSIAWGPQGDVLLATRFNAARPNETRGWWASVHDARSGEELVGGIPLPPRSRGCAFLDDGTLVLPDALWRRDGTKLCELEGSPAEKARLVLVAGQRIAVASAAGVQIYTTTGARIGGRERRGHLITEQLTHAEWSPRGDTLLASFQDGELWLLDAAARLLQVWNAGSSCQARFMPDGERIVTGDSKGRVCLWNRSGHALDRLLGHRHNAYAVPVGASDILIVSWDGRTRVWHLDRALQGLPFRSGFRWGRTLVLRDRIVASNDGGRVQVLDAGGAVRASTSLRHGMVFLAAHADARRVWLSALESGELWLWDPGTGAREGPLLPDPGTPSTFNPPRSLAHLAGGRLLLATGYEVPLRWFDPRHGRLSPQLGFKATHVAAPDGGRFAIATGTAQAGPTASRVQVMKIARDAETVMWAEPDPAGSPGARASALAVSRDGRHAVIGFQSGALSAWDLDRRSHIVTFRDHTDTIIAVAMSPDGRHVASATRQGHLAVYRLGVGRPVLTWRSDEEGLHSLDFVDDHTLISTGVRPGRLRWWWWEPDRLRKLLASIAPALPPLDADQRRDLERLLDR